MGVMGRSVCVPLVWGIRRSRVVDVSVGDEASQANNTSRLYQSGHPASYSRKFSSPPCFDERAALTAEHYAELNNLWSRDGITAAVGSGLDFLFFSDKNF